MPNQVTEISQEPAPIEPEKLEATLSHDEMGQKHVNHDLVDKELAAYTSETPISIDASTNKRLKRLIDKRVLSVMIVTYFLQSVDKSALPFASIMGLQKDTGLIGSQVRVFGLVQGVTTDRVTVFVVDDRDLSRDFDRRVPRKYIGSR
jgi:hypothetical protein